MRRLLGCFGLLVLSFVIFLVSLPALTSLPWWALLGGALVYGSAISWVRSRRQGTVGPLGDGPSLGEDRPRWTDLPGGRF